MELKVPLCRELSYSIDTESHAVCYFIQVLLQTLFKDFIKSFLFFMTKIVTGFDSQDFEKLNATWQERKVSYMYKMTNLGIEIQKQKETTINAKV